MQIGQFALPLLDLYHLLLTLLPHEFVLFLKVLPLNEGAITTVLGDDK